MQVIVKKNILFYKFMFLSTYYDKSNVEYFFLNDKPYKKNSIHLNSIDTLIWHFIIIYNKFLFLLIVNMIF